MLRRSTTWGLPDGHVPAVPERQIPEAIKTAEQITICRIRRVSVKILGLSFPSTLKVYQEEPIATLRRSPQGRRPGCDLRKDGL